MESVTDDPKTRMLILAILVKRLGGSVEITQADIDIVAFNQLHEKFTKETGILTFNLIERKLQG